MRIRYSIKNTNRIPQTSFRFVLPDTYPKYQKSSAAWYIMYILSAALRVIYFYFNTLSAIYELDASSKKDKK